MDPSQRKERLWETEMRMLGWIKGATLRNRKRTDGIRREFGVEKITFKKRQARLRWYGHILRMNDGNKVKRTMTMEV